MAYWNKIQPWRETESDCGSSGSRLSSAWEGSGFILHGSYPAGSANPLSEADRDAILGSIPEALAIAVRTIDWFKSIMERFREEISTFGNFPTLFMGIVKEDGGLTFYDGKIRMVDASGKIVADGLDPTRYFDYIGEKVESWSYLKSAYYKPNGFPDGIYRVGPLARLNVVDRCGTPRADQELAEFHELQRTAAAQFVSLSPRAADRNSLLCRAHGGFAQRPGDPQQARAGHRASQRSGRRGSGGSAEGHAVPSLQD